MFQSQQAANTHSPSRLRDRKTSPHLIPSSHSLTHPVAHSQTFTTPSLRVGHIALVFMVTTLSPSTAIRSLGMNEKWE
ncbi:hypothetical protein E2C01_058966 [Portunus trituberculatus]|uniref:Uncharacterized protein n=1 Tax=Portunus trituberculatus TaxID=210409 RepID=A0A5B7H7S5_PORTR|nr:hypothetical protein [Portunus trituberculatus]